MRMKSAHNASRRVQQADVRQATMRCVWRGALPAVFAVSALLVGAAGCSRTTAGPTISRAEVDSKAKQVTILLLMYEQGKGALPPAATWRQDLAEYFPAGTVDTAGLEYNENMAGKAIRDVRDPKRTVMIYEQGADRQKSEGGSPAVIGFVDGHVEAVDPSSVIWDPWE